MKRLIIILTITIVSVSQLSAQDCKTIGLEKSLVKKFINEQFGNLINPQSNNNIGNFASFDLKEAEVDFAGNLIFNNGSILGIKATGAVTDGFLPIFSNDKLNSKLGINIQYNFLNFKKKSIIYDNLTCEKYHTLRKNVENEYEQKKIEIEKSQKKIFLQIEIEKSQKKIILLETKLVSLTGLSKDSLDIEISKIKQELIFKKNQLENLPGKNAMLNELENWKASEIVKAQAEVKLDGFNFGWFSIGYGIESNVFKLFDGTLTYNKQISKSSYANQSFRMQYSLYNRTPVAYESYFFSFGTAFSIQDNFTDLTKIEINETKNYGLNTNDRFINSKYNAYQGSYSKDLKSLSFYGDFYWFLFDDNKGALHFYPEHKLVENLKPLTNLGFGLLMTFKNIEKTDNIVNAELYVDFSDVFDNNNATEKLITRSGYGIRFTFPINFNSKL